MLSVVKNTLPKIVEAGSFGTGCHFESFNTDNQKIEEDQFASTVIFGEILMSGGQKQKVVIKVKQQSPILRHIFRNDNQFHNEIAMYEQTLPFFISFYPVSSTKEESLFAHYFYGHNACGMQYEQSMIIIQNVAPLGYRMSKQRVILDYDHVEIALKALAKFHGMSYTAKQNNNKRFMELMDDIKETQWEDGTDQWIVRLNGMKKFGPRDINRLIKRNPEKYHNNVHVKKLFEFFSDADNNLRRTMNTRSPLSVLCHGDFCRNNIMFKYNDDNRPIATILLDHTNIRYGSLALDLSFFLFLNTDRQLRLNRWDQLLDVYCESLAASVPSGINVPDRKSVEAEMSKHAVYGLSHISFFLRTMMRDENELDMNTFNQNNMEEWFEGLMSLGGEKANELVVDVYEHIVEKGYSGTP